MMRWRHIHKAWCLWPPRPKGIIEMIGGSYLSGTPQLSYRRLLEEISKNDLAIHAFTYLPEFDHQAQANIAWKNFRLCRNKLEERVQINLPIIRIGHSLGAKLHLLSPDSGMSSDGFISLGFNNYSAKQSIPFFSKIAPNLRIEKEYSPNPKQTIQLISENYFQQRNLIISFNDDKLDQSYSLFDTLKKRQDDKSLIKFLPGDHLTPVSAGIGNQIIKKWYVSKERNQDLIRLIETICSWSANN